MLAAFLAKEHLADSSLPPHPEACWWLGDLQCCCLCAGLCESVSVGWISGTERWGTPCWWRDAKWNRWAETEWCQKRLIIRILVPKQTYCNQITYCNHRCIVLCLCVLCLWQWLGSINLRRTRLDQFQWHYSGIVGAHFSVALGFCSQSCSHNCSDEVLIAVDGLK